MLSSCMGFCINIEEKLKWKLYFCFVFLGMRKCLFTKELNQVNVEESLFLKHNVGSISKRITHVFDCELFCERKQKFLRECSVYDVRRRIVYNFHVYYSRKELAWTKTINFQIRKLHGLPLVRYKKTDDFFTQVECLKNLQELFTSSSDVFVAYKGGQIERDLCRKFNVDCINLELLGCPKFEMLKKIGENCIYHLPNKDSQREYHCSKVEVQTFAKFVEKSFYC